MATHGWNNIRRAFAYPELRTYLIGRFFFRGATWMYKIGVAWALWDLTQSATWLGVFAILDQGPALLITPVAGALADRMDSLRLMRLVQAALLVHAVAVGVVVVLGFATIWNLALFTLVFGAITGFQAPANQTIIPSLVEKKDLMLAFSVNSLTFNSAGFIGPMAAGYVISAWGAGVAILCNAIGAAALMIALLYIRAAPHPAPRTAIEARPGMVTEMREGVLYVLNHKGIGPTMVFQAVLATFAFSLDRLLPSLADGVYRAGADGLAWMTAAMGIGAIVSLQLARRGAAKGLTLFISRSTLALGAMFVMLATAPSIWLALLAVFAIGLTSMSIQTSAMTLVQYAVALEMRGRVVGLYGLINNVFPAIGSIALGAVADLTGVPTAMALVGAFVLATAVWSYRRRAAMAAELESDVP